MKLKGIMGKFSKWGKDNSQELLLAAEIVGLVTVVYTAFKAAPACEKIIKDAKKKLKDIPKQDKKARNVVKMEAAKKIAPKVLPVAISTVATGGCIIGSYKATSKKIALLTTAYQLSEKALDNVNKKMVDVLGEKKAREVKDAVVNERFRENPPSKDAQIIATGSGKCICQDSFSQRLFESSAEKINQAILELSHQCIAEDFVCLNDLYYLLGLKDTPTGGDFGWSSGDMDGGGKLPIHLTAILGENNTPVLCIDYDVHLRDDYRYCRGM